MPDVIINAVEANPPDKVFPTQTDALLPWNDKEVVFEGAQGLGIFTSIINRAKAQGKDLIIECKRIRFINRQGGA